MSATVTTEQLHEAERLLREKTAEADALEKQYRETEAKGQWANADPVYSAYERAKEAKAEFLRIQKLWIEQEGRRIVRESVVQRVPLLSRADAPVEEPFFNAMVAFMCAYCNREGSTETDVMKAFNMTPRAAGSPPSVLEVVFTINGVSVDLRQYMQRMDAEFAWQVGKAAEELVRERFGRLWDGLHQMERTIIDQTREVDPSAVREDR